MRPDPYLKGQLMSKNKPSKLAKIKNKIKENPEETVFWTLATLVGAGFTALTVYAIKEENKQARELDAWVKSENSKGNSVFQLIDGSYLAVPTPEYVNQI